MTVTITERYSLSNYRILAVDFFGTPITITLTSTPSVVRKWIRTTLHVRRRQLSRLVVGLGVQWVPHSNSGAATLQLCVGRRCLIFQLAHSNTVPKLLRRFLVRPENTFVGIWNHSDASKLLNSKHELEMVREPLDLRLYASSKNGESLRQASFETIARECLGLEGVRLDGYISKSQWDENYLSDGQVLQACADAHVSFEIGKILRAWDIADEIYMSSSSLGKVMSRVTFLVSCFSRYSYYRVRLFFPR